VEFAEATKTYPMSFPVWLALFFYTPDNNTHDHCRNPIGNPFNVAFDTQMLVLCHNETILREWYSIKGDTVKIFDLAEWKGDEGFVLLTNLSLYDRRNNMEGIVLRAVSVKVFDKIRRAFLCGCVPKFIVSAKNLRYVHYIFSILANNFGTKSLYDIFSSTVSNCYNRNLLFIQNFAWSIIYI